MSLQEELPAFICVHNQALSVIATRSATKGGLSVRILICDTAFAWRSNITMSVGRPGRSLQKLVGCELNEN
jgi:hypothetical protein